MRGVSARLLVRAGFLITVAGALSVLSPPWALAQTSAYTILDLGATIGGGVSFPGRVNNAGIVVGRAGYDAGAVVGTSNTGAAVRAFVWTANGGMRDLGTLPGDSGSEAFGINGNGQVVGASSGPQGIRAILWNSNGIRVLDPLPGSQSSKAFAINDSGVVVGTASSAQGQRAVRWTPSGQIRDLGTLVGDTSSEALAINGGGLAVGYSQGPTGTRAVLWTPGGQIRELPPLPGATYSRAFAINDAGVVVGTSSSANGIRAVVWSSTGQIQDLNSLVSPVVGLVLSEAHAINTLGQIAALSGAGEDLFGGEEHEHSYHAFLLLP
jgi:probable HAF family extracellular repeat protein